MVDSDAIFDLSLHQAGDITLNDTAVYAAIVELLLELEGVDPEPDFSARSPLRLLRAHLEPTFGIFCTQGWPPGPFTFGDTQVVPAKHGPLNSSPVSIAQHPNMEHKK